MTASYDDRKEQYNKFPEYDSISYNCISYLIQNNELIWRLLKYTDLNAWKLDAEHPNLTQSQKGALIYGGQPNETDYKVFQDVGADNSWTVQTCILRISPLELDPTNYIYGNVAMGFEVYSHYQINHLSNYKVRTDMITQQLIEIFNGVSIAGIGRLYFDSSANSRCRTRTIGSIPFKGKATVMCNWI